MNFAIVLYTLGKKLSRLDAGDGKSKLFMFIDDGTINEIRLKFLNKELLVEPMAFWNATKAIKQFLYE